MRYEAHLDRIIDRALKQLELLQRARGRDAAYGADRGQHQLVAKQTPAKASDFAKQLVWPGGQ